MQEVMLDFNKTLTRLTGLCQKHYGERLVSLAVFGSVGRGTPRPNSDIDLLVVVRNLSNGRLQRVEEFTEVESALQNKDVQLSPVIKTPDEIQQGSPLLLDMVEDARILYDHDDFLKNSLQNLKNRLERLGARRIWRGNAWYWDLKPDYKEGEVFEI